MPRFARSPAGGGPILRSGYVAAHPGHPPQDAFSGGGDLPTVVEQFVARWGRAADIRGWDACQAAHPAHWTESKIVDSRT